MSDRNQLGSNSASWEAWGNHVLTTLEKLETKVDKLEEKIGKQREQTVVEIATLKAKAGVWGSVAGVIAGAVTSLIIGLLIYQVTQGINKQPNIQTPTNQPPISKFLPHREDPLAGFNLNAGGEDT
jgi:hypothetical protein